jgi:hypothetical protein
MLRKNTANTILSLFAAIGVYYFIFKNNEAEVVGEQGTEEPVDNAAATNQDGNAGTQRNEEQGAIRRQGSSTEFDVVEEGEIDNGERGTGGDVQRLRMEEAVQRMGVNDAHVPPPLYVPDGHPIERFDVVDDEEAARVREEDRVNINNNRVLEVNATPFVPPPPPLYVPDNNYATILGVGCGSGLHEI